MVIYPERYNMKQHNNNRIDFPTFFFFFWILLSLPDKQFFGDCRAAVWY